MSRARCWVQNLACAGLVVLAACGGGGDQTPATWTRPSATAFGSRVPVQANSTEANATAQVANTLVGLANQGAENWVSAQVITGSLLGAGSLNLTALGGHVKSPQTDLETATPNAGTNLCGSGSVKVEAEAAFVTRMLNTQGGGWQAGDRFNLLFKHCVIDDGSLGLAQLADGSTLDGRVEVSVSRYNSASDYAATLTFIDLHMTRAGGATSLKLDLARFALDYSPRAQRTVLDTGSQAYIDGQVSILGQNVIVAMGTWRTHPSPKIVGVDGWVDLDYSNWHHDRGALRAQSGSVDVLGQSGVMATITAQPGGDYLVSFAATALNPALVFYCPDQEGCSGAPEAADSTSK